MCRLVEVLINLIDSLGNSAVTTLLFQTIKTRTECIHCQGLLAFDFFDFSVLLLLFSINLKTPNTTPPIKANADMISASCTISIFIAYTSLSVGSSTVGLLPHTAITAL